MWIQKQGPSKGSIAGFLLKELSLAGLILSALSIIREYEVKKHFHAKINTSLYKMLNSKRYKVIVPNITEEKHETVEETIIPEPVKENYNFITMGRLSPEKGQDNLIKAFGQFQQNFPNSKLYILGEGPLRRDLENLIAELKLRGVCLSYGTTRESVSHL